MSIYGPELRRHPHSRPLHLRPLRSHPERSGDLGTRVRLGGAGTLKSRASSGPPWHPQGQHCVHPWPWYPHSRRRRCRPSPSAHGAPGAGASPLPGPETHGLAWSAGLAAATRGLPTPSLSSEAAAAMGWTLAPQASRVACGGPDTCSHARCLSRQQVAAPDTMAPSSRPPPAPRCSRASTSSRPRPPPAAL